MALLDMFDKLDDIIYKPIETACEWIKEPLRNFESKRQLKAEREKTEIALHRQEEEMRLKQLDAEKTLKLEQARARAYVELDNLAADSQLARNTAMVEAIKRYKEDLARVTQEIIQNVGMMNLELRSRANDMLLAKTRDYKALQDEAIEKADKRLLEIQDRYGNNERVRIRMEDAVIDQMTAIIGHADKFMEELSADLRKINDTIQVLTEHGIDNVEKLADGLRNQNVLFDGGHNQSVLPYDDRKMLNS